MIETTKQISVFLENEEGQLAKILADLSNFGVDILALNISETEKYGVMRIIVENPDEVLAHIKDQNYLASISPVFIIGIPNKPGSLKKLIEIIASEKINVDYMYSMVDNGEDNTAYMSIAVNDNEKMKACLEKNNINTYSKLHD